MDFRTDIADGLLSFWIKFLELGEIDKERAVFKVHNSN
jgi:hypothetical protein